MSTDLSEEPPKKYQKLNNGTSSASDIILRYTTEIMNKKSKLKVVLADDYVNPVPLTKAYIGFIKDVKNISKAMKALNENLPLKSLSHLKRARGPKMLISHVKDFSSILALQEYIKDNVPELQDMFQSYEETEVPACMPKVKWQYAQVSKNWACNFHPDVYIEGLLNGVNQSHCHYKYMAMSFETVKWYLKNKNMDVTEDVLKTVNASVVVDPSIDCVVAVSFDNRTEHPLQHSAMVAIDNVARTQGGGAWSSGKTEDVSLSGINEDLLVYLKESFPDTKFGAKKYVSKKNVDADSEKAHDGPYLCTNYYVYTLREPCVMCSMALTHARVKKVFFSFDNIELGGLSSRVKLHTVPYLNHHYEVFTGYL